MKTREVDGAATGEARRPDAGVGPGAAAARPPALSASAASAGAVPAGAASAGAVSAGAASAGAARGIASSGTCAASAAGVRVGAASAAGIRVGAASARGGGAASAGRDGVRLSGGATSRDGSWVGGGEGTGAPTPREASAGSTPLAGSRAGAGAGAGAGSGAGGRAGAGVGVGAVRGAAGGAVSWIAAEVGGAVAEAGAVGGCGSAIGGWGCGGDDDRGGPADPGVMRFVRFRLPSCTSVSRASVAAVAGCEASCRRRSATCRGAGDRAWRGVWRRVEARRDA